MQAEREKNGRSRKKPIITGREKWFVKLQQSTVVELQTSDVSLLQGYCNCHTKGNVAAAFYCGNLKLIFDRYTSLKQYQFFQVIQLTANSSEVRLRLYFDTQKAALPSRLGGFYTNLLDKLIF